MRLIYLICIKALKFLIFFVRLEVNELLTCYEFGELKPKSVRTKIRLPVNLKCKLTQKFLGLISFNLNHLFFINQTYIVRDGNLLPE